MLGNDSSREIENLTLNFGFILSSFLYRTISVFFFFSEFTGTVTLTVNDVVQNGQGTLVCQIEGDTIYDVEWQFKAEGSSIALPIVNSGTVWTSNSTQGIGTMSAISELRIDNWPSENDGTYICEVNQGSGQGSALVNGGK